MLSNISTLSLSTSHGHSSSFFKDVMKMKLIDDLLPADFPDPFYISTHTNVITTEQLPWLNSPAPPVPDRRSPFSRSARDNYAQAKKLNEYKSQRFWKIEQDILPPPSDMTTRPLPPLPSSPSSSSSPTETCSPTLPSYASPANPRNPPRSTESIIKWMDERLTQQQQLRIPPSPTTSSSYAAGTSVPVQQPKLAMAPALVTRQPSTRDHSESISSNTARVLASLPPSQAIKAPSFPPPSSSWKRRGSSGSIRSRKPNKYDPSEWPSILSEDMCEQDRMVAQHYVLRTAFDGEDFAAPIHSALDKGLVVLDVGCGSGTWTMEMAAAFPNSTFIGLDRSNCFPQDIKPKNCYFRALNIMQLPLPLPDNSVDYIFQRDLNWYMLADMWNPLVKEYMRILKPGGWVELVEPDLETQSSQTNECTINDKLLHAMTMRQQDPYVARRLSSILAGHGFRRVESHFQSLPLGWGHSHGTTPPSSPTSTDRCRNSHGSDTSCSPFALAVSSHYMFTLKSLQPWLSAIMNISPEKYETHVAGLPTEWRQAHTYINWHRAVAQKPPMLS